jgi:hypothetical protein
MSIKRVGIYPDFRAGRILVVFFLFCLVFFQKTNILLIFFFDVRVMEETVTKANTSHMTPVETRKLLELLVEALSDPDSTTPVKGYFTKQSWDEICEKFIPKHPRFNRSSLQNRWDRLEKSYYAHMELATSVSGADADGCLPPSAEEERASSMNRKEKGASIARKSGCMDLLEQLLEGRRATGEHALCTPSGVPSFCAKRRRNEDVQELDGETCEAEAETEQHAPKRRRGSPSKEKRCAREEKREKRMEKIEGFKNELHEKFD